MHVAMVTPATTNTQHQAVVVISFKILNEASWIRMLGQTIYECYFTMKFSKLS